MVVWMHILGGYSSSEAIQTDFSGQIPRLVAQITLKCHNYLEMLKVPSCFHCDHMHFLCNKVQNPF